MPRPTTQLLLPWTAVLVTVGTAGVLLLGPLWDTAEGENPLTRPDPAVADVLRLAVPTLVVALTVAVALLLPRRRVLAGVVLVALLALVLTAPTPLPLWFAPALVLTAAGYVVAVRAGGPAH
ncbi:hypothetical protein [Ornithinimicrobium sp. W1665]|uniref:hypothetical protein n=1 Tax=Ornithinimicrobium sp. W1665 TaxID=3416666 RepID=UPI003CF23288